MRIAITGGTGFVGRHLAATLAGDGHEVVAFGRGGDLATSFRACDAVVHCAGINREMGTQTYAAVHVEGTRAVIAAAQAAGVSRIVVLSFLRARPNCGSGYHESKWAAEELVRASGLDWTVLKAGVIYGRGDHMLDHMSRAFHSLPVFGLVRLRSRPVQPVAVADVVQILAAAAIGDPRLRRRTFAVLGPDRLTFPDAAKRVARVVGRRPLFVPIPVIGQRVVAAIAEALMTVPLIATAQVRILAEGVVEALPSADTLPADLLPRTHFDDEAISAGLPPPGGFGRADFRWGRA